jgi:translation initiation factor 2B subunit (eIF-2B alpha/beta/delta family)
MEIDIEYKKYLIDSKIKSLNGRKQLIIDQDPDIIESIENIEAKIQVLTNLLEMI